MRQSSAAAARTIAIAMTETRLRALVPNKSTDPDLLSNRSHALRVEQVVTGNQAASRGDVAAHVKESWHRCVSRFGLHPDQRAPVAIITGGDLRVRRQRCGVLLTIARVEMARLVRLLNAPVGVMLTDDEGVILGYEGSDSFADVAHRSGLREGAVWSEARQGTNGMGTCLTLGKAVLIDTDEHFLSSNTALTSCGAPVRNSGGTVVGALNISGHLHLSAAPTLALVRLAVQNIENRTQLEEHRRHRLLRFHPHRECIGSAGEGILAIDDSGRIAGANMDALAWLGAPDHRTVCGQPVQDVLGLDMDRLDALSREIGLAHPLPKCHLGALFYGILQPPLDAPRQQTNVLVETERAALRGTLDRCNWNVSRAALQLKVSRRTLHRKLKAHGLKRYSSWID